MNIDDALPSFIAESGELLREMEAGLLECAQGAPTAENINLIFRAAHTIKGSSGLFGLDAIVAFVHGVETVLDRVRLGNVPMDQRLVGLMLSCKDYIEDLVNRAADNKESATAALDARGTELLASLRDVAGDFSAAKTTADAHSNEGAGAARVISNGAAAATDAWHISLRFGPDVLTSGMDPLSFIRYLGTFGEIIGIAVIEDALPAAEAFDPQRCYLGFEIAYRSSAERARIEAAFEFVKDDCTLRLLPPRSPLPAYVELLRQAGFDDARLRQVAVQCKSVAANELEDAFNPSAQEAEAGPAAGEESAPAQSKNRSESSADSRTVRVDANKLDYLITRVGELITASASANLIARRSGNRELEECTSTVSALIEQVREGALQLRMVRIGGTFNRFQRVVHDVSRELGKKIELVVSGKDTELDKTVVERIGDPLTHLVRNAIDHGIEPAEVRAARGKPAVGTIKLNAYHDSGSIVIEVSDDGGGLKRDRILEKGIERGLVEAGRTLTDSEIFSLIFEPGFSTAEKVTNLSGRGVGMDVVKRNITALRGAINIKSTEGVGTTVTVRLPLTLAIINGFQIAIGTSIFVMPLEAIEECVEFSAAPGHDFTNLRGEVLPFIRLRELFATSAPAARRQSIVVIKHAGRRAGLVVDALLGEFQTVIKPLGKVFRQVDCVSGSSILGTGEVALILDVPALVQRAMDESRGPNRHEAAPPMRALA